MMNASKAQSTQTDTLNRFTGIWLGIRMSPFAGVGSKKPSFITWRIHNIDNLKNQIELTEVGEDYRRLANEVG